MEPLTTPHGGKLPAMTASSADGQICAAEVVAEATIREPTQASKHSIEQTAQKRSGLGLLSLARHRPNRISAMEKSTRGFAENTGDYVIVPKLGTNFHTLGEAYDFYNLYSWKKGWALGTERGD